MNSSAITVLESAPFAFIRKMASYLRNKWYNSSANREAKRLAPAKVVQARQFISYLNFHGSFRQSGDELLFNFKAGFSLYCRPADIGAVSETCITEDYQKIPGLALGHGQTVFDIGAHIGSFSIYAAAKGCRVYAFEPEPENYRRLVRNIKLNHFENLVTPLNYGIFSREDKVNFSPSSSGTAVGTVSQLGFASGPQQEGLMIEVKTLGRACDDLGIKNIDLIKMDIEGSEYEIFKSLSATDYDKIRGIVGEYHLNYKNRDQSFGVIYSMLKTHFHQVGYYSPYYFFAIK